MSAGRYHCQASGCTRGPLNGHLLHRVSAPGEEFRGRCDLHRGVGTPAPDDSTAGPPSWLVLVGHRRQAELRRSELRHPAGRTFYVCTPVDAHRLRGLDPRDVVVERLDGCERLPAWHLIYAGLTYLERAVTAAREARERLIREQIPEAR